MWIVFVVVYCIYALTSFLSVPGGDSGELLSEICLSGVPHPPGYPLFQLLSKAILLLPNVLHPPRVYLDYGHQWNSSTVGTGKGWNGLQLDLQPTPAWRVNHMCCLFGAATAALMAASIGMLLKSTTTTVAASTQQLPTSSSLLSSLGAFLFALSPLVWEYMIGAEVFALNNLLCAILVYLTVCICHMHTTKSSDLDTPVKSDFLVCIGALVCGASLANQHASLLFMLILVPGILWITVVSPLFSESSHKNGARSSTTTAKMLLLISSAVCFFVGFVVPYGYLMYTSKTPQRGSWGDVTTLTGLFRHMLRSEYGTFQLGNPLPPSRIIAPPPVVNALAFLINYCPASLPQ